MPLLETKGAASAQGFGEFAQSAAPVYIEDVFSTWLYTGNGNGTTGGQSINNGIDLSTKGGLIWTKSRSDGSQHQWCDTARGINKFLRSEVTNGQYTSSSNTLTSFNSNGYTMGADSTGNINYTGINYASWTFRKQPKFFDVVTYTGNGSVQNIAHNLGSVPGCIIVKGVSGDFSTGNWAVYHRSLTETTAIQLNNSNAAFTTSSYWNNTAPTSTQFTVGTAAQTGAPNTTYVAYLFAHNAGGFGLTGTDNVISCGSYTGNGSATGPSISLGYEPQWVLIKNASYTSSYWMIYDNMRGWPVGSNPNLLYPNVSDAEVNASWAKVDLLPTGFQIKTTDSWLNQSGDTYIYIAIRRGPMKTPTSGTSVFAPVTQTGNTTITTNFPVDTVIDGIRNSASGSSTTDRLRGSSTNFFNVLNTYSTSAETSGSGAGFGFDNNTGYAINGIYGGTTQTVMWNFRRAPGFFDVVCYTGNATARTLNHNLGVVPEMMIGKSRSGTFDWCVYHKDVGNTKAIYLNGTGTPVTSLDFWNDTTPTASVFTIGTINRLNTNNATQVMYLFASCPGVSKVGSYTGTGALQTINCGFTGGARFVLIKRTDSTGDWFVYDSARGITSGNDPYLLMNSTAAEVTGTNYVDTTSVGFQVTAAAPAGLNANGGTYIYLAIA